MLIPSVPDGAYVYVSSLSRRVNANSQRMILMISCIFKLIKKGEC